MGGRPCDGSKNVRTYGRRRPGLHDFSIFTCTVGLEVCVVETKQTRFFLAEHRDVRENAQTTLSGGSLGSCVDEERSQLREVM